jgi:hypothetical protein
MLFEGPTFTMEAPTNWVVSSSPQFQAIFLGPTDQPIRPNLIISIHPVNADVTPESVAETARQTQTSEYNGYEVLAEVNFSEYDGQGVMRRYRWVNPNGDVPVVQVQAFFIHQAMLHTLTATRAETVPAGIGQNVDEIFDRMMQSFRFRA